MDKQALDPLGEIYRIHQERSEKIAQKYKKLTIAIRYWLLGKGYLKALKAMEFARKYHIGKRKDGMTPEFQHQLEIVSYLRTLDVMDLELVITATFLHDVLEDYDVEQGTIIDEFGEDVNDVVWLLTKTYKGAKKTPAQYFEGISGCPRASLIKGADRVNNMGSMVGAFTLNGQKHYVTEVENHFFPMLKIARQAFPQQESAYENIKLILENQVRLVKSLHLEIEKKKYIPIEKDGKMPGLEIGGIKVFGGNNEPNAAGPTMDASPNI